MYIEKDDVASAWIEALKMVMKDGDSISTSYDKKDEIPSKDATVMIKINKPFSNPMRNKRSKENKLITVRSTLDNVYKIYGHMGDYCLIPSIKSGYIEEVLDGVFDDNLHKSEHSYPYSYHNRLFDYIPYGLEDIPFKALDLSFQRKKALIECSKLTSQIEIIDIPKEIEKGINDPDELYKRIMSHTVLLQRKNLEKINLDLILSEESYPIELIKFPAINQIELVIEGLKKSPISRRIQAITWRPYSDPFRNDPPCLQRLHFRVKNGKLNMNSHWRSRDLYKAWQSNVNAMIRIQKLVADKCGFEMGCYMDISDSLHIYGRDIKEVELLLEREK